MPQTKTIAFLLLMTISLFSCKHRAQETAPLELAKKYYEVLDQSAISEIGALLTDSLLTRETEYDYEQTFSKAGYIEWLQWDAVFEPTYKVLHIEHKNDVVNARISKTDKRIDFLHKEPIITDQVIRIENGHIISVETTKYVVFNDATFINTREKLVAWIADNHPKLNGFLYPQDEATGRNYLEAIERYKKEH